MHMLIEWPTPSSSMSASLLSLPDFMVKQTRRAPEQETKTEQQDWYVQLERLYRICQSYPSDFEKSPSLDWGLSIPTISHQLLHKLRNFSLTPKIHIGMISNSSLGPRTKDRFIHRGICLSPYLEIRQMLIKLIMPNTLSLLCQLLDVVSVTRAWATWKIRTGKIICWRIIIGFTTARGIVRFINRWMLLFRSSENWWFQ